MNERNKVRERIETLDSKVLYYSSTLALHRSRIKNARFGTRLKYLITGRLVDLLGRDLEED